MDVNLQHRVNPFPFAVEECSVITQPGVVDQKIEGEIALNQPITEALQFILVAKV